MLRLSCLNPTVTRLRWSLDELIHGRIMFRKKYKIQDPMTYCRCVRSEKLSNGKRKGSGNTKNGNRYLSWAFVEAAHFAVRYEPQIRSFYQRKKAKTHGVVAIKAVAHKLARACYHIMRDEVPFDVTRAFS